MHLHNEYRPNTWAGYLGQGTGEGGVVDWFTTAIAKNLHPSTILITGPSGSGKSSCAKLYCKATLCRNRQEGEFEACGTCPVCTGVDTTNINEYTVAQATDFKESIDGIKEIITSMPVGIPERVDQYRRFMIIDEIQFATRQSLSAFLDTLEYAPITTTVILVSMDFGKLDPVLKEAIESRCIEHTLSRFSDEDVARNLCKPYFDELEYLTALAIAYFAKGNMRKAWQILQSFNNFALNELTPEIIYKRLAGGADEQSRHRFWGHLTQGDLISLRNLIDSWIMNTSPEIIVDLLIKDIIYQNVINNNEAELLSLLAGWLVSVSKPPLIINFIPFLNKVIRQKEVDLDDSFLHKIASEAMVAAKEKSVILPFNDSVSPDLGQKIKAQLNKIKPLPKPFLFTCSSFGKIYDYYVA